MLAELRRHTHKIRRIFTTSAFRLTLLFSALLIGSVALLFGLVYWQSAIFLTHRLDETLMHEAQEFLHTAESEQSSEINSLVASDPRHDWQVGLFSADRQCLAGNVPLWPDNVTVDGVIHDGRQGLPNSRAALRHDLRVLALPVSNKRVLVIAHSAREVREVRALILQAMTGGLLASVALALMGGLVISFASLRRIEAMHRATARIVSGDLSQRLPVTGSGDDFDKLADIVNEMLADIERLIADIKAAGDNIAHDLRTPLTRLRIRLDGALRRGGDETAYRTAMEDAIADTDQILRTFRALLRISEVESGERRTGFGAVDLVKLVSTAADLFAPLAVDRGLQFETDIQPTQTVRGDPDLIFEALVNLLDNAIKFTPSGGTVRLVLSPDLSIHIADNGPGLPLDIKETLFQRFTRGDKARHTPGNGLGLSLVAAVMRLHGFTLTLEDGAPGCLVRLDLKT